MNREESILIVGASARHIAYSAKSAGMRPIAIDLFADQDLTQIADASRVDSLSAVRMNVIHSAGHQPIGFVICGGMETRFGVLRNLNNELQFLGPNLQQIVRSQDPFALSQFCNMHQIRFPPVRGCDDLPANATNPWLIKPRLGSGGQAILRWETGIQPSPRHFLQKYIEGTPHSATFVFNGKSTNLLGITRQIVGCPTLTRRPFAYCGSVGPVQFSPELTDEIERFGRILANEFELVGCFGIDVVVDDYGRLWLIEINPRITASAEILELSGCIDSVVKLHLDGCAGNRIDAAVNGLPVFGKAVVFSHLDYAVVISQQFSARLGQRSLASRAEAFSPKRDRFSTADIPQTGTVIQPGHPVVSVICGGASVDTVFVNLQSAAQTIRHQMDKLADMTSASC